MCEYLLYNMCSWINSRISNKRGPAEQYMGVTRYYYSYTLLLRRGGWHATHQIIIITVRNVCNIRVIQVFHKLLLTENTPTGKKNWRLYWQRTIYSLHYYKRIFCRRLITLNNWHYIGDKDVVYSITQRNRVYLIGYIKSSIIYLIRDHWSFKYYLYINS